MNHNNISDYSPSRNTCHRTRLATIAVASVERCDCKMMHVHIGALTIRMTPDAVAEIAKMLSLAIARYAAPNHTHNAHGDNSPFLRLSRGEA